MLVLGKEQSSNFARTQIGFVSYPEGVYSPVTRDTNSYSDLSVASSGHILATVQNESRWNLQVMPTGVPAAQARQVTLSRCRHQLYLDAGEPVDFRSGERAQSDRSGNGQQDGDSGSGSKRRPVGLR